MAERAEVFVKYVSKRSSTIDVTRMEPNGKPGFKMKVSKGGEERIPLLSLDPEIIIKAPDGKDACDFPIKVKSDVAFNMKYSRENGCWHLKLDPNDDPPNSPVTVNVELEDDEPIRTGEEEQVNDEGSEG